MAGTHCRHTVLRSTQRCGAAALRLLLALSLCFVPSCAVRRTAEAMTEESAAAETQDMGTEAVTEVPVRPETNNGAEHQSLLDYPCAQTCLEVCHDTVAAWARQRAARPSVPYER
jgi:hypothetical protein